MTWPPRSTIAVSLLACAVAVVATACTSATTGRPPSSAQSTPSGSVATQSLIQVLEQVANDVGTVSFTDWSALQHSPRGLAQHTLTPGWVHDTEGFTAAVGVAPTAPSWQLDLQLGGLDHETITQWTDTSSLDRFLHGLQANGWQRKTTGTAVTFTRAAPLAAPGWTWAFQQDFRLDPSAGVLVEYKHDTAPVLPHGNSIASVPTVQALVAATPGLLTGQLRIGPDACPQYGLVGRQPAPSVSFFRMFADAIGGLRPVLGIEIGVSSRDGAHGRAAVALPDPTQAADEAGRRADAVAALTADLNGGKRIVAASTHRHGAVDSYDLRGAPLQDLADLIQSHALGLDSCGLD